MKIHNPLSDANIRQVTLEAIQFRVEKEFLPYSFAARRSNVHAQFREWDKGISAEFLTEIMGQHNEQTYTVSVAVPATWWDHFKRDYMPSWFTKRYEVKTKIVTTDVTFDHMTLLPDWIEEVYDGRTIIYTQPKSNHVSRKGLQ